MELNLGGILYAVTYYVALLTTMAEAWPLRELQDFRGGSLFLNSASKVCLSVCVSETYGGAPQLPNYSPSPRI